MDYQLHPLCTLFPRIEGKEFELLKTDIQQNGLREPIVLHDGFILDGGNRYRACIETDTLVRFVDYDGDNLAAYVLSKNLHRRHLSAGQQAAIVASAQSWSEAQTHGGDRKSRVNVNSWSSTAERATESGSSVSTQKKADAVVKANPELGRQVAQGKVSLEAAVKQVAPQLTRATPRPQPEIAPVTTIEPEYTELDQARDTIQSLVEENEELNDKLAAQITGEVDGMNAADYIAEMRSEIKSLRASLEAVTISRDTLMNEGAAMKQRIKALEREVAKGKK
jgi:hypothetical protein